MPNLPNQTQTMIKDALKFAIDQADLPSELSAACEHATLAGGKRVRPVLCFAAYLSCNPAQNPNYQQNLSENVRLAATAVELIHCYSLVHDDLPCMDDDDLRRGQPTCHKIYGEATALLAGDVLQSIAFELLAKVENTALSHALGKTLAAASRRMVAGQMRDLQAENFNSADSQISQIQLEAIHRDKTGALIEAAITMGGLCADASQPKLDALSAFSKNLGLAFQVQDDILDITSSTAKLGKPAGSDDKLGKATYPRLMGLDAANSYADTLFFEAKNALKVFAEHNMLIEIADWLWSRQF